MREVRLLKHKRMYEEQRNMLCSQNYSLDQMNAMRAANKELKGVMKTVKTEDIDECRIASARLSQAAL